MVVIDGLQALVENSLILQVEPSDGAPRFRMFETLHEYALAHLEDSGEAGGARAARRLLSAPARRDFGTSPHYGGTGPLALERLEAELDNLRAALGWRGEARVEQDECMLRLATALVNFWWKHLAEGVDWMHRALRLSVRSLANAEDGRAEPMRLRARSTLGGGWSR